MGYLPIGSVITLQGGSQPLMIYGRKQVNADRHTNWDYVACLYPEGNIGDVYNVFFDKEDIERVLFVGYQTRIDTEMQRLLLSTSKIV